MSPVHVNPVVNLNNYPVLNEYASWKHVVLSLVKASGHMYLLSESLVSLLATKMKLLKSNMADITPFCSELSATQITVLQTARTAYFATSAGIAELIKAWEPTQTKIRLDNAVCFGKLSACLPPEYSHLADGKTDTYDLWLAIQNHFLPKNNATIIHLKTQFAEAALDDFESLSQFRAALFQIAADLKIVGKPLDEEEILIRVLQQASKQSKYADVCGMVTSMLQVASPPSTTELWSMLLAREKVY